MTRETTMAALRQAHEIRDKILGKSEPKFKFKDVKFTDFKKSDTANGGENVKNHK